MGSLGPEASVCDYVQTVKRNVHIIKIHLFLLEGYRQLPYLEDYQLQQRGEGKRWTERTTGGTPYTAFNALLAGRLRRLPLDEGCQTVKQGLVIHYIKRASPAVLAAGALTGQGPLLVQVPKNGVGLRWIARNPYFCMVAPGVGTSLEAYDRTVPPACCGNFDRTRGTEVRLPAADSGSCRRSMYFARVYPPCGRPEGDSA